MEELFFNNELYSPESDNISTSITQNWTPQAIECYSLNCDCKKCSLSSGHYSFICQMPRVIETLLETIGEPETIQEAKIA